MSDKVVTLSAQTDLAAMMSRARSNHSVNVTHTMNHYIGNTPLRDCMRTRLSDC